MRISDWGADVCSSDLVSSSNSTSERRQSVCLSTSTLSTIGASAPAATNCCPGARTASAGGAAPACPTRSSSMRTFPRSKVTLSRFLSNRTSKMVPSAVTLRPEKIDSASCREGECQYVQLSVDAVTVKKKNNTIQNTTNN